MTRIIGFTDYFGPLGGFTCQGHYSGIATTRLSLASLKAASIMSSGTLSLGSSNGNLSIGVSGNITVRAGGKCELRSSGTMLIRSSNNLAQILGNDVSIGADSQVSIGAGTDIDLNTAVDLNAQSLGVTTIHGDHGIVLVTDIAGLVLPTSIGIGSISGVASQEIFLSCSGNMKLNSENGNMNVTASGNITFGAINNMQYGTYGGAAIVDKTGNYQGLYGGTWSNYSTQILLTTLSGGDGTFAPQGETTLRSILGDVHVDSQVGQVLLDAWASSGQLKYLFGPYEAWHTSPSHTSDFFPIPHSGQVVQMISEAVPNLIGISGVGVTNGTISGVNQYSSLYNSSNTASFITGGGISLWIDVDLTSKIRQDPIFKGTNPIQVQRTGWYRLSYNISLDNPSGSTRSIAQIKGYNDTTAADIPGSYTYIYCRISTGGEGTGSVAGLLFYATAGDNIKVQARRLVGDVLDLLADSSITLEFIGDWNE